MLRINRFLIWQRAIGCLLSGAATSALHAQVQPVVIMIHGEATATRADRQLAQRVGALLQHEHPDIHVVPADSLSSLLEGHLYAPNNPLEPWIVNDFCSRLKASASVDIMMAAARTGYRGLAFRHAFLRRPSKIPSLQIQRLVVGDVIASTPEGVARALVPAIVESLVVLRSDRNAIDRYNIRCFVLTESGDTSVVASRAAPNTGCC